MSRRRKWMEENKLNKNKSAKYVLPMFDQPLFKNSPLDYYLINSYYDKEDFIYIVFDNGSDDTLTKLIYNLTCHPNYIDSNYGDDNKEIIIKMEVPEKFKVDFESFKQGKFTKFTQRYKKILSEYFGRVSSRKERDSSGKPIIKIFDAINPTKEKYQDIADYYNVDVKEILEHGEILEAPNEEKELFRTVEELYGVK